MENKSIKDNGKAKAVAEKIKSGLSYSLKHHKALWIVGIIILVIVIVLSAAVSFVKSDSFAEKAADMLIPKKIHTSADTGLDMTFYREINPEYAESETKVDDQNNYIQLYVYYYIDDADNKVYLDNGEYNYVNDDGENQTCYVGLGFLYAGGERINTIQTVLKVVAWVLVIGFIVAAVVVWYIKDKQHYERNKPKQPPKAKKKNKH